MRKGHLSQYFAAVAAKRLTAVEVDSEISNQHEFNGVNALKPVLGTDNIGHTTRFPTSFLWIGEENETVSSEGFMSWYDSRFDHPTRSEWRLFYSSNEVIPLAKEGDLVFIAKRPNDSLMCIVVPAGTTMESQLIWLFDVPVQDGRKFVTRTILNEEDREVNLAVRLILNAMGVEIEEQEVDYLDNILEKFQGKFPSTKIFSDLARASITGIDPYDNPDTALVEWMNFEEKLFRRLERQIVDERLRTGFVNGNATDVDGFISFSLSVQNRRKSRVGSAFENHVEKIFQAHKVNYVRTAETENRAKPDFLFPSKTAYDNPAYSTDLLSMLGVKTTCKDRWRQVLSEAKRIDSKHLLTLEPSITETQTDQMQANRLQLVLPAPLHNTYNTSQQSWLMNVSEFIELVLDRQKRGGIVVI